MAGLFQQDLQYPSYPTVPAYNPANYQSLLGSGLYSALQGNATAQEGNEAAAQSRLPGNSYGGAQGQDVSNASGYGGQQAQEMTAGQLQPWDAQQQLGQYGMQLGQANQQAALNAGTFGLQNQANQQAQAATFGAVGTGLGAALGYSGLGGAGGSMNNPSTYQTQTQSGVGGVAPGSAGSGVNYDPTLQLGAQPQLQNPKQNAGLSLWGGNS